MDSEQELVEMLLKMLNQSRLDILHDGTSVRIVPSEILDEASELLSKRGY